jgi:hypothetical protein
MQRDGFNRAKPSCYRRAVTWVMGEDTTSANMLSFPAVCGKFWVELHGWFAAALLALRGGSVQLESMLVLPFMLQRASYCSQ